MLASDWSTRDHVITVDKSEAPRTPVSQFYSRKFLRRYFGGDWKPGNVHAVAITVVTAKSFLEPCCSGNMWVLRIN